MNFPAVEGLLRVLGPQQIVAYYADEANKESCDKDVADGVDGNTQLMAAHDAEEEATKVQKTEG